MRRSYRVWVDVANSPQALFFAPVVRALRDGGVEVFLTARDASQTLELAALLDLRPVVVGRHAGSNLAAKALDLPMRALALARAVRRADLALSHNSYHAILAARALGIRTWTFMDYEHQPANHLAFRLAHRIFVPELFPARSLSLCGAHNVTRYAGLKEEVYVSSYDERGARERCGFGSEVVAVVRPHPTRALYRGARSNRVEGAVAHLLSRGARVVYLPRYADERVPDGVVVPPRVVYGLDLLAGADLLVGGGGTMNREAALLGTPVYSSFTGKRGALDAFLVRRGKVVDIDATGVRAIEVKRAAHVRWSLNPALCGQLVSEVVRGLRRLAPSCPRRLS